jgi:sugar phosphate isomerase/epimerase
LAYDGIVRLGIVVGLGGGPEACLEKVRQLGLERPLGAGRVDFPRLMAGPKALGYDGAITIEREIGGPEQIAGIEQARRLLSPLL